jgi:broad specificity phosphatase PhoE
LSAGTTGADGIDSVTPRSLVVVRHGRTAENARGLLLGRADPHLDDVGRTQAGALAATIGSGRFGQVDAIVSSPLARAVQTAERLAASVGVPVQIDDRLIEIDYGELEGIPVSEVPEEIWRRWRSDVDFRPSGGETLAELGHRVRACCDAWMSSPTAGSAVVLVSHVSPVKAAVAWALGVDDGIAWRAHLDTASITRIVLRGGRPVLSLYNETAHLR